MAKVRTTVTLSAETLKAVRIRAARSGQRPGEVIEAAIRSSLGMDLFADLWARNDLGEEEAMSLALEAQAAARGNRQN